MRHVRWYTNTKMFLLPAVTWYLFPSLIKQKHCAALQLAASLLFRYLSCALVRPNTVSVTVALYDLIDARIPQHQTIPCIHPS